MDTSIFAVGSHWVRWILLACWLIPVLALVLWVAPWTPLRNVEVIAMLVAPDSAIGFGLVLMAVGIATVGLRSGSRRAFLVVSSMVAVCGTLFFGRVLVQGVFNPTISNPDKGALAVLSWNAQGVPPEEMMQRIIDVVMEREVDVIVLPETGSSMGERASAELEDHGWEHVFFGPEATSILIDKELAERGGYRLLPGNPPWAGITVAPTESSAQTPVIMAVHIQQASPGNLAIRNEHLAWVEGVCSDNTHVLAIGDFNSTLNQFGGRTLGDCADVAAEHRSGAASTWPVWLPPWLGVAIDRAMVSPPYAPEDWRVEILRDTDTSGVESWGDGRGADHWPILATLESTED